MKEEKKESGTTTIRRVTFLREATRPDVVLVAAQCPKDKPSEERYVLPVDTASDSKATTISRAAICSSGDIPPSCFGQRDRARKKDDVETREHALA